ncbi:unnamed protein product [Darwinula stevensoni]|uniref:Uncharacterized protein n=1 Tax=Darwinula stevensoni TaxID=69355 RepID=A0A7R8X7D6_9CRUS|nr:unnamed protein product [Darwinula stevensoni]CAG0889002.1 unnamed protein product [Darwinula stevensoni]
MPTQLYHVGECTAKEETSKLEKDIFWFGEDEDPRTMGIFDVITTYLQYPVSTTVSTTLPEYLEFPAVTVCNLAGFSCSKFKALNSSNYPSAQPSEFDQLAETWLLRYLKDRPSYLDFLSRLNPEDHVKIMQNRDEFIRMCIFKEKDCRKYFLPFLNTTYVTCYAFNLILNNASDPMAGSRYIGKPGDGMELTLYMNKSDWPMNWVWGGEGGVIVDAHRPNKHPSLHESRLYVRPGAATYISMTQKEVSRLAYPYEHNCYNSWDDCGYYPANSSIIVYDSVACRRMCIQSTTVGKCNCKDTGIRDYFTYSGGSLDDILPCIGVKDKECAASVVNGVINGSIKCPCNPECGEIEYKKTVSSLDWPSRSYFKSLFGPMGPTQAQNYKELKEEVLYLHICFSSIIKDTITELPTVSMLNLISSLGGVLSLYLGISLALCLEILEIIPLMMQIIVNQRFGISEKQDPEPKTRVPRQSAPKRYPAPLDWAVHCK